MEHKMAHHKHIVFALVEDWEQSTGLDAPQLPMEAFSAWDDDRIRAYLDGHDSLKTWAPALRTVKPTPTVNVVCFHSSGLAEDMYTGTGTGRRRTPNPLVEWCAAHRAQLVALQLPGRALRRADPPVPSMQDLAQQVLTVLQQGSVIRRHDAPPYLVVGHSMGCWAAYELMRAVQQQGLPLPVHTVLACMPSPTMPATARPWTPQDTLDDNAFQDECRAWGPDEALFQPAVWALYRDMFRADFALFDRYVHTHAAPPLAVPATLCWAGNDTRVQRAHVLGWKDALEGPCTEVELPGGHMCVVQDAAARVQWLQCIVSQLAHVTGPS